MDLITLALAKKYTEKQINELNGEKIPSGETTVEARLDGQDAVDAEMLATIETLDSVRTARSNPPSNIGFPQYDGAVLTFTDDDGTLRFLTEHVPVYRNHGVTATTAVVACRAITTVGTTTSGDPYEAMSFEQLRALAREGFDIQSHTWSHARSCFNASYNQSATDADIDLEYRRADETFRANGIDYNCMVFPWGAHQARHLSLARRYARFGVNCRGTDGQNDGLGDPMDLNRLAVTTNGGNLNAMKAAIDTAIARGGWLILLTHAGMAQPDAASLDELLTYAQAKGIRIENFREAARIKAPAYYAGQGDTAFRVMPDGRASATLDDASVAAIIERAYELGCISPAANAIESIAATWTGGALEAGDEIDTSLISVTATMTGGGTRTVTGFTVDGSLTAIEGANALTMRYGTLSATLTITVSAAQYVALYSLTGAANASAPATIADTSESGNTGMTVTGVASYDADGSLAMLSAGQMLSVASFTGLPTAYTIHMHIKKVNGNQHRVFVIPATGINVLLSYSSVASSSGTARVFVQCESSDANCGFTSPISLCDLNAYTTLASIAPIEGDLDIAVNGDVLTTTFSGTCTGRTLSGASSCTITGFTAALALGIQLGNRAAGDRPLGGTITEFWIREA